MWLLILIVFWGITLLLNPWLKDFRQQNPVFDEGMAALPALLAYFAMLLYHEVDAVYFAVNRWLLGFRGLIRAEFDIQYTLTMPADLQNILNLFNEHFPHNKRKNWIDNEDTLILTLPNTVFRVSHESIYNSEMTGDFSIVLHLESTEVEMPFRTWERVITSLSAFFRGLQEQINPINSKYTCNVIFAGHNPYFGLFLRKAHVPDVISFNVHFKERVAGIEETVQIGKSKVSIIAESIAGWEALANKYIGLSKPPNLTVTTE